MMSSAALAFAILPKRTSAKAETPPKNRTILVISTTLAASRFYLERQISNSNAIASDRPSATSVSGITLSQHCQVQALARAPCRASALRCSRTKGAATGGQKTAPLATRPKESLGTALLFAAGMNLVGLFGNTLAAFLTEPTPTWTWFVTPVVALAVALVTETLGHYRKSGSPQPPGGQDDPHRPPVRRRPWRSPSWLPCFSLAAAG